MTTSNSLNIGLSGSNGTGNFVGNVSPTLTSPILVGITNAGTASAGNVGEVISSTALSNSTNLSSGTAVDITSISLTAGVWLIMGSFTLVPTASPIVTQASGWINTTSATAPTSTLLGVGIASPIAFSLTLLNTIVSTIPTSYLNTNGSNIYYLSVQSTFTVGTVTAGGKILAYRLR